MIGPVEHTAFTVDPWDPGYGTAVDGEAFADPETPSRAEVDLDVELPAAEWRPLAPPPGTAPPEVLLIADGVRRIDARIWLHDPDGGMPSPGIAASYAAGVVRCTPGGGPAVLAAAEVGRGVFSAAPQVPEIVTAAATYRAQPVYDSRVTDLSLALQRSLTRLEEELAERCRAETGGGDLLVVDGPLRGRSHLPRTVGYIKTHHAAYLESPQAEVVSRLAPGQRTPVFLMGTSWRRHAWYLKLPTSSAAPWAGVVRCEAGADLAPEEVIGLADAVALALPPLAGIGYKDARAPQNLVPIGGLERLLRHRLGDPGLLYRALRTAARDRERAAAREALPVIA